MTSVLARSLCVARTAEVHAAGILGTGLLVGGDTYAYQVRWTLPIGIPHASL